MIFSISSSPSLITSFTTARFPTSTSLVVASTSRISSSVAAVAGLRRSPCPYIVFCASKVRGMEEMLDEKKGGAAAAATVASSSSDRHEISSSRIFLDARSEQDLLIGIQKESEAGRLPIHIAQGMEELYQNYRNADPFEFSPHHEALREPFDYFMFGQNYIRPLIDFRGGSKIIWIAPSGGRDRPDPVSKEWHPAPFDASSVDNMRRLTEHAGSPGNIYPLAILCYDIMPPPSQVEKEIGEKRLISFHGTGLSVAHNISYHEIAAAMEDPEEAKAAYTQSLYSSVNEQYNVLKSAIHGKQGLMASTPTISLSQPWQ